MSFVNLRNRAHAWLALALAVAMILLVACSGATSDVDETGPAATVEDAGQETPAEEATEAPPEEPTAPPTEDAAETVEEAAAARVITHSLGETPIEGTPQRIVALEWTYAEDLLALGVQPVGVADLEGYHTWVNAEPELADTVADVGTRQEPNLEAISALEPDLIIGVAFRHEPIYENLTAIAPTLIFNPYPAEDGPDQFAEMVETFNTIAEAVDRQDQAAEVLDAMEATFAEARAQLEEAGMASAPYVLAQAFSAESGPQVRIFTDNAMAAQLLNRIGLENAWEAGFEVYGFSTVGIEALAEVQDANFIYVVQSDDDVFANQADNPVWNSIAFVQEGRIYPLGGDTWLFGGPLSAQLVADLTADLLTE